MLIETKTREGTTGDVSWMEGVVSMGKVKLNVYCFAVDGMLIDTGAPRLLRDFDLYFQKTDFDQVALTHSHEDHVGGASYIQRTYNKPVYMSSSGVEACKKKADYPVYRKVFWGRREPFTANALGSTFQSRNATWDVIETPGHADDHLSFYNRDTGQLFSGDLFVQPETKLILKDESIPEIIRSIKKVLVFDFQEVFCCHAGYLKNGRKMLRKKLEYLENLQGEIVAMNAKGLSEKEIRNVLFGKKYPITYLSLGEWDSIHMIRSVLRQESSYF